MASLIAAFVAMASQPRNRPMSTAWTGPTRTSRARAIGPRVRPDVPAATPGACSAKHHPPVECRSCRPQYGPDRCQPRATRVGMGTVRRARTVREAGREHGGGSMPKEYLTTVETARQRVRRTRSEDDALTTETKDDRK